MLLTENFLPWYQQSTRKSFKFLQDNAPVHMSKECKKFIHENNIHTISHPAASPDLNIIENVWSFWKSKVEEHTYTSISEMEEVAIREWNIIPIQYIQNCIMSMSSRLREVIKTGGKPLKV